MIEITKIDFVSGGCYQDYLRPSCDEVSAGRLPQVDVWLRCEATWWIQWSTSVWIGGPISDDCRWADRQAWNAISSECTNLITHLKRHPNTVGYSVHLMGLGREYKNEYLKRAKDSCTGTFGDGTT